MNGLAMVKSTRINAGVSNHHNDSYTAFHWKIEFALFWDRATSSTHQPKNRFQFHTVSRWPHNFGYFSPSNDAHTVWVNIFKENDPFTAHKWRDKYARGQRSQRELRLKIREKNKINSNIYEITFLFMTVSCVCLCVWAVRVEWVALPTVGQYIITLTCLFFSLLLLLLYLCFICIISLNHKSPVAVSHTMSNLCSYTKTSTGEREV